MPTPSPSPRQVREIEQQVHSQRLHELGLLRKVDLPDVLGGALDRAVPLPPGRSVISTHWPSPAPVLADEQFEGEHQPDAERLRHEWETYRDGFLSIVAAACGSPFTEAQQQNAFA